MYNMTNITAANNVYEIVKATNQASGNMIASLILLSLFMLIFLAFKNNNFKAVLLADSFIITIVAIFMFVLDFIGWHLLVYPIIILMFSLVVYLFVE